MQNIVPEHFSCLNKCSCLSNSSFAIYIKDVQICNRP